VLLWKSMALEYNSLGYLLDPTPSQGDSTTASTYTTQMREQLTEPQDGMICYDPDAKGLLFFNGSTWIPVISSTSTKNVVTVTQSYTVPVDGVDVVVADCSTGWLVLTLPSASSATGKELAIVKADASANTVTIQAQPGDSIGDVGDNSFVLGTRHAIVKLMSASLGVWYCV
jgi:hypothetical protein